MRQQFGNRRRLAVLYGLVVAASLWVIWLIADQGFEWGSLIGALGAGIGGMLGGLIADPFRDAFPPMTLPDEKVTAWRIVRDGGPVENPADAPRVAHYAQWVLRRRPIMIMTIFLVVVLSVLLLFGVVLRDDDDPESARVALIMTVIIAVALITVIARIPKQRRNAERALTASRAAMPEPPTGNGSARPGSPGAG